MTAGVFRFHHLFDPDEGLSLEKSVSFSFLFWQSTTFKTFPQNQDCCLNKLFRILWKLNKLRHGVRAFMRETYKV